MPEACDSWHIAWHTRPWREAAYVGEQLLRGWSVRGSSCHGCEEPLQRFQDACAVVSYEEKPAPPSLEDCSAVVVRIRQWPHCAATTQIARRYRAAGLRHFFVLVGEEHERSCASCPEFFAIAPLVARHYHEPSCDRLPSVLTLPMGVVAGISALDQLATQRAAALTSREAGRDNAELGAIEGPPEVGPTECAASRRRLAWSFASSVHSVARTRLAEFLQRSAAALAMPHTLYYPWAPRPGERQPSTEYLRTLCDSAFVFCPRGTHEDTWRFYEAAACGAIPIVTDRSYWARFMPKDVVELLLETRCDFTLTTTGRHRDDITTCSERSFEATVDAIGALLSRPEALDEIGRAHV